MRKMNKPLIATLIILLAAISAVAAYPVKADAKRIIVPDDYPTINAAIANASDGDTIYVKNGTYQETQLNINKKTALIGENAQNTTINFNPPSHRETVDILGHYMVFYGNPMEVNSSDFSLSGFTVNSTGGYIRINGDGTRIIDNRIMVDISLIGAHVVISGNQFSGSAGFNCSYSKFSSNTFSGMLSLAGKYDIFRDNNIHQNARFDGDNSLISGNQFTDSKTAILGFGGSSNVISNNTIDKYGFGLSVGGSNNTVFLNKVTHCGMAFMPRAGSVFFANYIAENSWGLDTGDTQLNPDGKQVSMFNNNFVNNRYQVNTLTSVNRTDYFDNGTVGNYWNDYHGQDRNSDGLGDSPYVVDGYRVDRYPLVAPFNLSSVAPIIPDWATPPTVRLISPQTIAYQKEVPLNFVVSKAATLSYSLDGGDKIALTENCTLTNLPSRTHNITVFATDVFENTEASGTVTFQVESKVPVSQNLLLIVVIVSTVAVVACVAGADYVRRRRKATFS
jgi:nitrous oxidase accessory protein NosD